MFAPKVAKPQTVAATSSMNGLAHIAWYVQQSLRV